MSRMSFIFAVHLDLSGSTQIGIAWQFDPVTFVTCHHVVGKRVKRLNKRFERKIFFLKSEHSEYVEVHTTRVSYMYDLAVLEPIVARSGPFLAIRSKHVERGMVVFLELQTHRVSCILDGMPMKQFWFGHRLLFHAVPGMSGTPVTDEDGNLVGMVLSCAKDETLLLSFKEILHELIERDRDPGQEARAFARQDVIDFHNLLIRCK